MESPPFPVAGRDYPRTFEEFDRWFSDEEACQRYLIRVRWAAGFRCPHCTHRVVSLLKRWLLGTHQGAVSRQHIDYYLDEFTFRFNRRSSRSRGLLFYRLLQQAVATDPVPYRRLVGRG